MSNTHDDVHAGQPGCGDDDSVVDAFAESEIHLVDIDADCVRELRQKSTSPRLHIVEASAVEYDPGPVDVLVLHGPDHEMQMNTCLNTVIEGGFILSGDDSGTKLRDELINRSDLELAGIVCSSTTPDSDSITSANTAIRKKLGRTLQEFHFKKGEKENVTLVETDEEFKTATPKLYGLAQNQWRATKEFCKNQKIPDSILEFTKMMKSISIPPKQPGAALWIFRKVSQGME